MAAKPRPPRRPPDIQEIFALHLRCSQRLDELLEECRELKAAGKVAAARKALKQAQSIQAGLNALEAEVRVAGEHRRDKRFAKD
ncbi:MAG: hypothetical protein JWO52_4129 [Gammaproteobacteria bacterium]|nr:hypothetical protein [Gammaproteobacteria bacterium]